jgi:hypothetical protein
MPTSTFTITNVGDDGNVNFTGTALYTSFSNYFLGSYPTGFTKFSGITIPQSTSITSAKLKLNLCQKGAQCGAKVWVDNRSMPSPTPSTLAATGTPSNVLGTYISRTGASTSTAYAPNTFTKTNGSTGNTADYLLIEPDVTSMVQTLVNTYNYSNDSMLFKYKHSGSKYKHSGSNNYPYFAANNLSGGAKSSQLVIDYVLATLSLIDKTTYIFD